MRLVEKTDELRRDRRERIRDIEWKREDEDRVSLTAGRAKERIYEHDRIREVRDTRGYRDRYW